MITSHKAHRATTCGFCKHRVPQGHECEQKREAMRERPCRLESCGKTFKPKVYLQAYCCDAHKKSARNRREYTATKAASRVTGPREELSLDEKRAAEMEPVVKRLEAARQVANVYVPLMGEALRLATVRLMGGAA